MLVGAGARISAGATAYSAAAPSAVIGRKPMTSSPTATLVDALAERVDGAGDVDAGDVRQRHRERVLQIAAADAVVDGVERRRGDAEPHLAGTGDGLLDVLVAEDVGVAVLVETHCLHVGDLSLCLVSGRFRPDDNRNAIVRFRSAQTLR